MSEGRRQGQVQQRAVPRPAHKSYLPLSAIYTRLRSSRHQDCCPPGPDVSWLEARGSVHATPRAIQASWCIGLQRMSSRRIPLVWPGGDMEIHEKHLAAERSELWSQVSPRVSARRVYLVVTDQRQAAAQPLPPPTAYGSRLTDPPLTGPQLKQRTAMHSAVAAARFHLSKPRRHGRCRVATSGKILI